MKFITMNEENKGFLNTSNEAYEVIGELEIHYDKGDFKTSEKLYDEKRQATYPPTDFDVDSYINDEDKTVIFAVEDGKCIGQIALHIHWNKSCYVDDIAVKTSYRNKGLGKKFVELAGDWAKSKGLKQIMLETQNLNLMACRFYKKAGFRLGGFDTSLYRALDNPEIALFWYKDV